MPHFPGGDHPCPSCSEEKGERLCDLGGVAGGGFSPHWTVRLQAQWALPCLDFPAGRCVQGHGSQGCPLEVDPDVCLSVSLTWGLTWMRANLRTFCPKHPGFSLGQVVPWLTGGGEGGGPQFNPPPPATDVLICIRLASVSAHRFSTQWAKV